MAGQCWQDYPSLQAEGTSHFGTGKALIARPVSRVAKLYKRVSVLTGVTDWRSSHDNTDDRVQCRVGDVQEPQL